MTVFHWFSGKSQTSLCCPLCQALLSNRNALRYHMNYVHAMQAPSAGAGVPPGGPGGGGGTKLHWFLGGQLVQLRRPPRQQRQIIADTNSSTSSTVAKSDPLVVLFSESARCHFCAVLCPDRATLKAHLEETHQPPRHALCENCENFFHICAITRHRSKCMERYQQQAENTNTT